MQFIIQSRDLIEQAVGSTMLLLAAAQTLRFGLNIRRAFKSYEYFMKIVPERINYNSFISNPAKKEYVIIPNLSCTPDSRLFQAHMKMVDDYKAEAYQSHSYSEKCDNFEAQVIEDHKRLKIVCDCHEVRPFASSSLLCNIQSILRNKLKQKATMFVYGQLTYSQSLKSLVIQPESCATSREEIYKAWEFILGVQTPFFVVLLGLAVGVGSCLVWHHREALQQQGVFLGGKAKAYLNSLLSQ